MSSDCIFCKIIAGQIPSATVFRDADTIAFMDIAPVVKGHTLVVPKLHCDPITETPAEVLQRLILVVQKVARAQFKGLGAKAVNVTQANGALAGQVIPHIHFHVIPRFDAAATDSRNWIPGRYDTPDEMQRFAERLRNAL